jgi:hypothetical protein
MGSSAYKAQELPHEVRNRIDTAIEANTIILVAEAHGACRRFQDYLAFKGYRNVVVGHAKSMRYNAGNWCTIQYGHSLKERERNMILDCDSAVIIWQDESSVIAENLELLKKLGKPTFLYEYNSVEDSVKVGELDPNRAYRTFYPWREYRHKRRQDET